MHTVAIPIQSPGGTSVKELSTEGITFFIPPLNKVDDTLISYRETLIESCFVGPPMTRPNALQGTHA